MELGAFSVSLSVQDLATSHAFYARLGFAPVGGAEDQGWLILRNGQATIGLFQGMFDGNMLTFNPGWVSEAETCEDFTDIRDIQADLKDAGVAFVAEAEAGDAPASFIIRDPDGNAILVDQHVPRPPA